MKSVNKFSAKGKPVKDYSKYPFMNLSLESIEGEQWKDMPQFDGAYFISNYGRIWAAPRPVHAVTGQHFYTRERIRKQCLTKYLNTYSNDHTDQLNVHLRFEGKNFSFKVSRLVYEFFVGPLDPESKTQLVIHKDGDNCNNRYDNLVLMNGTELHRHLLQLKRRPRSGSVSGKAMSSSSDKNKPRPVVKYSLDGKVLEEYKSVDAAAKANNTTRGSIRSVTNQKAVQLYGYVYRYKGEPYRGEHKDSSIRKVVTQYNLDGKKLKTYPSIKEAGRQTGTDADAISKCALKKTTICGGFVWRYEGDQYNGEYKDKIKNQPKELVQYNLAGKKIASFASVNEASTITGFSPPVLLNCAYKKAKTSHGFVWRFAGDTYSGRYKNYHRGKPVTRFSLDGKKMETYPTIQNAANATGLTPDNIQKNVNGHNKTAGGFVWKFAVKSDIQKLKPVVSTSHVSVRQGNNIVQYSIAGKKLAAFPGITEAARACGINISGINSAIDKLNRTAAGFVWRTKGNRYYGSLEKIPPPNKAQTITQYDLKGRKVKVYESIFQAAKVTGLASSTISKVVRGKLNSTGGFIWLQGNGRARINIKVHFAHVEIRFKSVRKPVLKYSLEGKLIREYPSIQAAAREEGISAKSISAVVNGQSKSAGGDFWKLKE